MVRDEQESERDERERGKEMVKATERWNRGSGKVRVRQLTVCVGFEERKGLFCVLVSLHNSTPGSVCVHLHKMI